jgi:hypothetical protein
MSDKASQILETAINTVLQENEDYVEGDLLMDWVVICYVDNADEDAKLGYPRFVSNNSLPPHRLLGLLEYAAFDLRRELLLGGD